jgi:hypothetical protein
MNLALIKIFTVVALAHGSTTHQDPPKPAPKPVIKPRTLPNGRPACGNTGGKAPPRCATDDTEMAKL